MKHNKLSKIAESLEKSGRDSVLFGRTILFIVGIGILVYSAFFSFFIVEVFIIVPKGLNTHNIECFTLVAVNLLMYGMSAFLLFVKPDNN